MAYYFSSVYKNMKKIQDTYIVRSSLPRAVGTRVAGMAAATPIFERFTNACHTNILDKFESFTITCHTNILEIPTALKWHTKTWYIE